MKTGNKLRIQGYFLLGFLALQYVLGMLTNLFVSLPEGGTDQQHWEFAKTQLPLMAHVILGLLLLVGSIVLLIRSFLARDTNWKIASSIGLAAILLAIVAGSAFISSESDYYSLVMSILFGIAVAAYGWGVYQAREK